MSWSKSKLCAVCVSVQMLHVTCPDVAFGGAESKILFYRVDSDDAQRLSPPLSSRTSAYVFR